MLVGFADKLLNTGAAGATTPPELDELDDPDELELELEPPLLELLELELLEPELLEPPLLEPEPPELLEDERLLPPLLALDELDSPASPSASSSSSSAAPPSAHAAPPAATANNPTQAKSTETRMTPYVAEAARVHQCNAGTVHDENNTRSAVTPSARSLHGVGVAKRTSTRVQRRRKPLQRTAARG